MDKTKGLIKEHEVPATLLFCSPTFLCECLVCPYCSFLGTFLQPAFVEPCAWCYVNTEQRGTQIISLPFLTGNISLIVDF